MDMRPGFGRFRAGQGHAEGKVVAAFERKGRLDLEHGGRTFEGVAVRVAPRALAPAAAIWHNHRTGQPITRSLITYDH
ncbi:hypothetical protein ACFCYM_15520 [Streptomyces sp. NPDC056254]|uniref:hypothetical protein n=1 Tax=Streptomyces sp. NPDC056254 TaxID=3345763 RepID=UPI0035DAD892